MKTRQSNFELKAAGCGLLIAWLGFFISDASLLFGIPFWPYRALLTYTSDLFAIGVLTTIALRRSKGTGTLFIVSCIVAIIFGAMFLDYLSSHEQVRAALGVSKIVIERVAYGPLTDAGYLLVVFLFVNLLIRNSQTQQRAADSEHRYQTLVENAPVVILRLDFEQRIISINREGLKHGEFECEESIVGTPFLNLILPDDKRNIQTHLDRALNGQDQTCRCRASATLASRIYSLSLTPLTNAKGQVIGVLVVGHDITSDQKAQEAVLQVEKKLRTVLLSIPDFIWSGEIDANGRIRYDYCSPVAESITGYSAEYLLSDSKNYMNIVHADDRLKVINDFEVFIVSDRTTLEQEYRIFHADQTVRWIRVHIESQHLENGRRSVHGVVTDITARREAEEIQLKLEVRLQQAQQFESLGVLAGGVAHDFNNLLVAIMGHTSLAIQDIESNPATVKQNLNQVETVAQRAADLCQQMLAYSGKKEVLTSSVDINHLIEEMTLLLQSVISKRIQLLCRLEKGLPEIRADRTQIRQILMNLILNAKEAIGNEDGSITLSSERIHRSNIDDMSALLVDLETWQDEYVAIVVADTGCGMDEATLQRVFDPYYSTKFTGRGLGMAATFGIVRNHKGTILIDSEPQKGTTVTVLLPVSASVEKDKPVDIAPKDCTTTTGSAKILVVDDERIVRKATSQFLRHCGFDVVTAANGHEAIKICLQGGDAFHAILLDLTMPELSGEETFQKLRANDVVTPVLFTSGYNEQASVQKLIDRGLAGFLKKPYPPHQLVEALNQISHLRSSEISSHEPDEEFTSEYAVRR